MSTRTLLALSLALLLAGCDSGSQGRGGIAAPAISSTQPTTRGVASDAGQGAVREAGQGTLAFLLADDSQAKDLDTLGSVVVDIAEVGADGSFSFAPNPRAVWVVVSAPGKALARAEWAGQPSIQLRPEARVRVETGEPYACCLVVDDQGRPLPLPAETLVSTADGVLTATRLPAGQFTLLVQSADGTHYAVQEVSVAEGEHLSVSVDLTETLEGARRFLRAVGGAAVHHPLYSEEGR